jgi:hypothetical protein
MVSEPLMFLGDQLSAQAGQTVRSLRTVLRLQWG